MKKEIFEKILSKNGVLAKYDLTPEEKAELYSLMERLGMSQSTSYLRFFSKGFDLWEISGITKIKSDYLNSVKAELVKSEPEGRPGDRGYAYVLALDTDTPGRFYAAIKEANLVANFKEYMSGLGMSFNTTWTRFSEDNWKEWELYGIASVIEQFCNKENS